MLNISMTTSIGTQLSKPVTVTDDNTAITASPSSCKNSLTVDITQQILSITASCENGRENDSGKKAPNSGKTLSEESAEKSAKTGEQFYLFPPVAVTSSTSSQHIKSTFNEILDCINMPPTSTKPDSIYSSDALVDSEMGQESTSTEYRSSGKMSRSFNGITKTNSITTSISMKYSGSGGKNHDKEEEVAINNEEQIMDEVSINRSIVATRSDLVTNSSSGGKRIIKEENVGCKMNENTITSTCLSPSTLDTRKNSAEKKENDGKIRRIGGKNTTNNKHINRANSEYISTSIMAAPAAGRGGRGGRGTVQGRGREKTEVGRGEPRSRRRGGRGCGRGRGRGHAPGTRVMTVEKSQRNFDKVIQQHMMAVKDSLFMAAKFNLTTVPSPKMNFLRSKNMKMLTAANDFMRNLGGPFVDEKTLVEKLVEAESVGIEMHLKEQEGSNSTDSNIIDSTDMTIQVTTPAIKPHSSLQAVKYFSKGERKNEKDGSIGDRISVSSNTIDSTDMSVQVTTPAIKPNSLLHDVTHSSKGERKNDKDGSIGDGISVSSRIGALGALCAGFFQAGGISYTPNTSREYSQARKGNDGEITLKPIVLLGEKTLQEKSSGRRLGRDLSQTPGAIRAREKRKKEALMKERITICSEKLSETSRELERARERDREKACAREQLARDRFRRRIGSEKLSETSREGDRERARERDRELARAREQVARDRFRRRKNKPIS